MKKNFFTLLLASCIIASNVTTVAFASSKITETPTSTVHQQEDNSAKAKEEAFNELFKKYNVKVLNEDEVKSLNLNELNTTVLDSSVSVDELEQIIIQNQDVQPIVEENEVTIHVNQDIKNTKDTKNNLESTLRNFKSSSSRTIDEIRTVTKTYSRTSKPVGNTPVKASAAGTYQYRYVKFPIGPPEISNKHFISCDDGHISMEADISMSPFTYKIDSIQSSRCKILTPTRLQHSYKYSIGYYMGVGIPNTKFTKWVQISSTPVSGDTYYNLED